MSWIKAVPLMDKRLSPKYTSLKSEIEKVTASFAEALVNALLMPCANRSISLSVKIRISLLFELLDIIDVRLF